MMQHLLIFNTQSRPSIRPNSLAQQGVLWLVLFPGHMYACSMRPTCTTISSTIRHNALLFRIDFLMYDLWRVPCWRALRFHFLLCSLSHHLHVHAHVISVAVVFMRICFVIRCCLFLQVLASEQHSAHAQCACFLRGTPGHHHYDTIGFALP